MHLLHRFGQLQDVDVSGVEPAVRADIDADNVLRDDVAVECENRYVTQSLLYLMAEEEQSQAASAHRGSCHDA